MAERIKLQFYINPDRYYGDARLAEFLQSLTGQKRGQVIRDLLHAGLMVHLYDPAGGAMLSGLANYPQPLNEIKPKIENIYQMALNGNNYETADLKEKNEPEKKPDGFKSGFKDL